MYIYYIHSYIHTYIHTYIYVIDVHEALRLFKVSTLAASQVIALLLSPQSLTYTYIHTYNIHKYVRTYIAL